MNLTLLSKGRGFHFPACYMLDFSGFRILLDCPIDLSALTIFHPMPYDSYQSPSLDSLTTKFSALDSREQKRQKVEKPLEARDLIFNQPWFKMVPNLDLWDLSFVDVVLISSPMGMLGLPFLTQNKNFSAKVYATEATSRIGQLVMEDLVAMHMEFRLFYGLEEADFPQWMKFEELELLPIALKEIVMGKDSTSLGTWRPLYSAADVRHCMEKVQTLKYAEEACYNGTLVLKAFSSGLEIGASNWTIDGPSNSLTYLSNSIFESAHAMSFDFCSLKGNDLILFSDFSSLNDMIGINNDFTSLRKEHSSEGLVNSLVYAEETSEEMDKLAFVCSCAVDSIKQGGCVLIPVGRLGIILQLLEQISLFLEASNLMVPIYVMSSVAEDILAFTNVVPEWLCRQRQENLYSGEPLFGHVELIQRKKLHLFSAAYSTDFLGKLQEPCIVFAPHWSLRLGPVVHLLRRWRVDPNSLLVLEQEVDADLALLPFKPMAMKVLQCSFLSGIKARRIQPLLEFLQPKLVLLPEDSRIKFLASRTNSYSLLHYFELETLCVPSLRNNHEVLLAVDLGNQLRPKMIQPENMAIAKLIGKLILHRGGHLLVSPKEPLVTSVRQMPLLWGSLDPELLLLELSKKGFGASLERGRKGGENNVCVIHIKEPDKAFVEINSMHTVVGAMNESFASLLFEAISVILNAI